MDLGKKLGPLPVWAWVVIAAAGVGVGLWLRRRGQSGASAGGATIPAVNPDPGSTSYPDFSGASSGTGTAAGAQVASGAPAGIDPQQYVNDVLSAFSTGGQNSLGIYQQGESASLGWLQTAASFLSSPGGGYAAPTAPTVPGLTSPAGPVVAPTPIPSSTHVQQVKAAAPFGGVVSTRTGKGGVKITTYASGRVVEQAPGKKPYVAKA